MARPARPAEAINLAILPIYTRVKIPGNMIPGVPLQSQPPS